MRLAVMMAVALALPGCAHTPEPPKNYIYECTWVNMGQECTPVATPCFATEREAIEYCIGNAAPKGCTNNGIVKGPGCDLWRSE